MNRAVVSIGVKKTGGLPELQAAVESATEFADWARKVQKIPASQVKLITDAKSPVSRDRIFDTVDKIVRRGIFEQLIVYFSGHGINSGFFEQWLLSRAPDDPAAAVDVKGSEFGARFCGISHVVFISDACRTAADSIQAQRVTGSDIFPNTQPSGPERPVDQFFATLVGKPGARSEDGRRVDQPLSRGVHEGVAGGPARRRALADRGVGGGRMSSDRGLSSTTWRAPSRRSSARSGRWVDRRSSRMRGSNRSRKRGSQRWRRRALARRAQPARPPTSASAVA